MLISTIQQNDSDSMLPVWGALGRCLIREPRSCMSQARPKEINVVFLKNNFRKRQCQFCFSLPFVFWVFFFSLLPSHPASAPVFSTERMFSYCLLLDK